MNSLKKAQVEIILIYLILSIVGYITFIMLPEKGMIIRLLIADLVMTVVSYILSVLKKNTSVYDAYWSVIPFLFLLFIGSETIAHWQFEQYLTLLVVSIWSWRLTLNWYRSWTGWDHEDWRYVDFRNSMGKNFEWINFFGLQFFPTVMVFMGFLGLCWVYENNATVSLWLFFVGCAVSLLGVYFERSADNTLFKYRLRANKIAGEILSEGWWKYSRNPNYLGEILFWIGVAIIGLSAGAPWWTAVGALAMLSMFLFVSIPLKEKRMQKSRPLAFDKYKRAVSVLIPLPVKKD